SLSGGALEDGGVRYLLRSVGEFQSPAAVADLPLNGQGLQLRDVAQVRYDYPEKTRFDRLDREDAVTLAVYRTSTANDVDVAQAVHRTLETIQTLPGLEALSFFVYHDSSLNILKRLAHLRNTGLVGGGLALLILFLFLRYLRATAILGLAIPISVMATFLIMYFMREAFESPITLNVVSFSGLMLSVGMLVDSSVVVLENIVRHRQLGKSAREARVVGATEVSQAVLVATATSIVVFLPTVFVSKGFTGRILSEFGLVLCAALVASLLVSLSGIPLLSAYLLSPRRARWTPAQGRINQAYGHAIAWTLRYRWLVVGSALVVFGASLALFMTVLLPNRDDTRTPRREMHIRVKAAHSVPFQQVQNTMIEIED
ncbi:MAG: efflux RND transporter permease subunit, partial [Proteobacteria bacterium]|nr:efflux RND transporter permease subunit [Pseudomonadota bacterium]